jgi:hypothetical protein
MALALKEQLLALSALEEEQTLLSGFWRKYVDFCLLDTIEHKRDNALLLMAELNLNLLMTQHVEPRTDEAVRIAMKILAFVVLLAHNKRADFLFRVKAFVPTTLQDYWGVGKPEPADQLVIDMLFLQARHHPNTEEFGTPYICDGGYNKILHEKMYQILDFIYDLTRIPLSQLAIKHMLDES